MSPEFSNLKAELESFEQGCIAFRMQVEIFSDLYRNDVARDVMSKAAPYFYQDLYFLIRDQIYISAARLLDPAKQRGHYNRSVHRIDQLSKQCCIATKDMDEVIQNLRSYREAIKLIRDKRLAHRNPDFDPGRDFLDNHYTALSCEWPSEVLKLLELYCNEIRREANWGRRIFSVSRADGDARSLIAVLQRGLSQIAT